MPPQIMPLPIDPRRLQAIKPVHLEFVRALCARETLMTSPIGLKSIRQRAGWMISMNLSLGLLALGQSLREGSTGWALFVWLAGLQGIALGLLAGTGWSDRLLNRMPPHRRSVGMAGVCLSILTYWGPIAAMFVFGLILANTLPDAARPASVQGGNSGAAVFQSWVTFFFAVGCSWLVVWVDSHALASEAKSERQEALRGI